ncbi:MAG: hypothetical protein Q8R28_10675 [Dehalococcoidia bacterium]|nr:hypothetical protein [Dehalococcoidia bacterium]
MSPLLWRCSCSDPDSVHLSTGAQPCQRDGCDCGALDIVAMEITEPERPTWLERLTESTSQGRLFND